MALQDDMQALEAFDHELGRHATRGATSFIGAAADVVQGELLVLRGERVEVSAEGGVRERADANVTVTGAELEAAVDVAESLSLFANIGYAKSEIEEFTLFPQYVGNHAPRTADWSSTAGFDFTQTCRSRCGRARPRQSSGAVDPSSHSFVSANGPSTGLARRLEAVSAAGVMARCGSVMRGDPDLRICP